MRIISGTHKGRKLLPPKKLPVRPTTDMAKEALFNIINNQFYFDELKVLDLFAGTGSISYEFASRGATDITSVDQDVHCIRFIEKTAEQLQLNLKVIRHDVFKYLGLNNAPFDLIFADPPYNFSDDQFLTIVEQVFSNSLLREDGLLIIEHSKHTDLSSNKNYHNCRNYGGSVFSFFSNNKG